ncbi:major royal jelly protein 1-like [Belonocnema kinseyi]|uniref:major royal jelly protein 1-like n=1 Tax=Belonocnema kinseyi TaxID=2817044 RepID=UPI00143D59A0|nr:major royal jelly protein 1-like [Belonocnema kinseyi]
MAFFGNVSSLIFLAIIMICSAARMNVIYQWKYIDYVWESSAAKQEAIDYGDYDFKNAAMIDVDQSEDGRTFVTVIRTKGVPASLNVVSSKKGPGGPLLAPYPDWSWYRKGNCNGITNVYRIAIDKCNRLWVLDNGVIDENQVCSAQILLFNLETNELLGRTKIPNRLSQNSERNEGLLITPIVQTEGKYCERARMQGTH